MDIFYTYYAHLNKQMEEQKEHVDQKLSEVERKQKAMIEAYKQKRLFEILHDKMLRAMVKETSLNEQKETDYDYIARKLRK
jgi:flagellar biosynthesis chaperone FliJ